MSLRDPRHHRSLFDLPGARRAGTFVTLWRWRTEFLLLSAFGAIVLTAVRAVAEGDWWVFPVLTGAVSAPVATRFGRAWIAARFWCVFSRHRIQRVCRETSLHTRAGRIPLVLWITPTRYGEKALIATRAGICAEDFAAFAEEIAAACLARGVAVSRHPVRANLVAVEILRRTDASGPSPYGLERLYGTADWLPVTGVPEVGGPSGLLALPLPANPEM